MMRGRGWRKEDFVCLCCIDFLFPVCRWWTLRPLSIWMYARAKGFLREGCFGGRLGVEGIGKFWWFRRAWAVSKLTCWDLRTLQLRMWTLQVRKID